MAGHEVDKLSHYPDTWPGVVSRIVEIGSESWDKLMRVGILLALLGGAVALIALVR